MNIAANAIRPSAADRLTYAAFSWSLAREQGLVRRIAEDDRFDGRCITLDGQRVVNFGSCSYLGLETDARLKRAACKAVLRYGVQFSSSRAYVAAPLYEQLESLLSTLAGGSPVVVAATTSLAHLSALPVLVGDRDAVLYDIQVHASVQAALPELRMRGVPCEPARHNRLDRLEQRVRALSERHERVHYLCDGIYSMHGDVVDTHALYALLDRQPALHAYVDDAHGMSWSGLRGAGTVLGQRALHPRMVVVFGLAKSFAAAGGAIVVPDDELAQRLLACGPTLKFSGPLQPAQLGAGVASAKLHLSDELPRLQAELLTRIAAFDQAAQHHGVPLSCTARSPIRFVPIGDERAAVNLAGELLSLGYYTNVACFPAVPRQRAGVRITLTNHQTLEDVESLVATIAARLQAASTGVPESAPALPRAARGSDELLELR